jgi:hypothetical protein
MIESPGCQFSAEAAVGPLSAIQGIPCAAGVRKGYHGRTTVLRPVQAKCRRAARMNAAAR